MIGDTVSALLSKIEGAATHREEIERVRLELNRLAAASAPLPGVVALLADEKKAAAGANFDFDGIPQNYKHLLITGNLRGDTAATNTDALLRLNGVSSANYFNQHITAFATTVTGAESVGATSATTGNVSAATSTANVFGKWFCLIPDYTEGTNKPGGVFLVESMRGTASAQIGIYVGSFVLNVAGAVTKITLTPAAGNWDAGSRLSLYGIG